MTRSGPISFLRLAPMVAVIALWGAAGCSDDVNLSVRCVEDSECPTGFACDQGRCICKSDASCAANELCNSAGFCQARVGCETSLDCPEGQFCDRTTGNCLDIDRCTSDIQCDLGEVCDTVKFKCVPGCRGVGDCALGSVCACTSGKQLCEVSVQSCPDETEKCGLGQCLQGPCGDKSYCNYGEICVAEAPGTPKRCIKDERGPYCAACTIAPGQNYCPGDTSNFCLIDTSKGYGSYFCGVECATDNECPWGFGCSDVLILTQDTCSSTPQGGSTCRVRDSIGCETGCPGGECDPATNKCRPLCVGGENDVQGFCTCLEDGDCPADSCGSDGRCQISRKQCDANNPCANIYCKNVSDPLTKKSVGYCFIGRNCAPVEGVTCDQVRGSTP